MTEYNVKVSVLITFYNQAEYVDRTLESVMSQERDFNMEVLIGDDGSTDGTIEKVQAWVRRYPDIIHLYERQEPRKFAKGEFSVSLNRLNLLSKVSGEYFIHLDGDDYYCDTRKLQTQIDILDNPDNSDCVTCAHPMRIVHKDGKVERSPIKDIPERKFTLEQYWGSYYFHPNTMLIRSSAIKKLPLDDLTHFYSDNMITFNVLQIGKVYYLPRIMVIYSYDNDGNWTNPDKNVNNLVSTMAGYDMYNYFNPKVKRLSSHRNARYWMQIIPVRKKINSADFVDYSEDTAKFNLVWFDRWSHYNEQPKLMQLYMILVAYGKCWKLIVRYKGGHIFHKYIKRDRR